MSAEDVQSQSGFEEDESMAGGPGAPTPLSALEVRKGKRVTIAIKLTHASGCSWIDQARHSAFCRWRLPHSRSGGVHAQDDT